MYSQVLFLRQSGQRGDLSSSTPVWRSGGDASRPSAAPSWLSMSMDAALGCRASIFQIHRSQVSGGKRTPQSAAASTAVQIHPQAAPLVCRHALDTLISLAKAFPSHFLPLTAAKDKQAADPAAGAAAGDNKTDSAKKSSSGATSKGSKAAEKKEEKSEPTDFWDLLVRLDSITVSRKGKGLSRTHSHTQAAEEDTRAQRYSLTDCQDEVQFPHHVMIKSN